VLFFNIAGVYGCHPLFGVLAGALLPPSRSSCRSGSWSRCICMCFNFIFTLVCPDRMFGVASVIWFFAVDTWPLALSSTDALSSLAWADTLPPKSLPSCGYFAAWSLADALPSCYWLILFVGWILCRRSRLFSVDALPPWLHLPWWQSFVLFLCRSSRLGCDGGSSPYHVSFFCVLCF
jgi:hypothetical protein